MANTFGKIFRFTSFGESHGKAIGGIIDGCPAGIKINSKEVQKQLNRRKPGASILTSERNEKDKIEFLSGIYNNTTLGTPIGFLIQNSDANPDDYDAIKSLYRPSHADFVYEKKYGLRDYRGGGRSSARETAVRVVVGSIAQQILYSQGIILKAFVSKVKSIKLEKDYWHYNLDDIDKSLVKCPDQTKSEEMISLIKDAKSKGDSVGGDIICLSLIHI